MIFFLKPGLIFWALLNIPARVRSEWVLRREGLSSICAPACLETSHVGNAGVGVVSLKGAPISMPTFAPLRACFSGKGRFLNLVVLYGCQVLILMLISLL